MQFFAKSVSDIKEISDAESYVCVECQVKPADIFLINGEYCLDCWQEITHTNL
jgi:hypothetical protein